jgi:Uma2 family endonuclease
MTEPAIARMTLAGFLEWNDGTDTRYELIDGRVVAMAPALEAHGAIVANLSAEFRSRLKPPCRAVVGAGIAPPDRADSFYVADVAVTCAPPEPGLRIMAEPTLIVEVLSPTSVAHDRGLKLFDYRRIGSVREILLVSAADRHVEYWHRRSDRWEVQDLIGEAEITLEIGGPPLALTAIYQSAAL